MELEEIRQLCGQRENYSQRKFFFKTLHITRHTADISKRETARVCRSYHNVVRDWFKGVGFPTASQRHLYLTLVANKLRAKDGRLTRLWNLDEAFDDETYAAYLLDMNPHADFRKTLGVELPDAEIYAHPTKFVLNEALLLTDKPHFLDFLKAVSAHLGMKDREIAQVCKRPVRDISKWRKGYVCPVPEDRQLLIDYVKNG